MTIKIRATVGLSIVGMLLATSSSLAAQHKRLRNCAPRYGVTVLRADQHAQVYQDDFGINACLRRGKHVLRLGAVLEEGPIETVSEVGTVSEVALKGTVVAYAESLHSESTIVVRSIASGLILHKAALRVAIPQRTLVELALPIRIAVKANGAVAWIQEDWFARHGGAVAPPPAFGIYAIDSDGPRTLRADLPSQPRSLKLVGSTLSWLQGRALESSELL